ncbi:HAD hydrolase family protein [Actinokineospora sp.]|uniref:HAD hydrolase family protein n=1 Tax=Actinokineospora sp. TaxID=1872133 RepID=UPI003D6C220E
MVVIDLDGTLLCSDGTLSPRSGEALRGAAEAGVRIVFATARPAAAAADILRAGVGDFLVSSNGAVVSSWATGRILRRTTMPAEVAAALIEALVRSDPCVAWAVDREDDRLVSPRWPDVLAAVSTPVRCVDRLPSGPGALCLMVVGAPLERCVAVAERFGVSCTSSATGLVEFSAPGAEKHSALDWVLGHLGLGWSAVIAYGDGLNDVSMLAASGVGVAVANACEEALRVADRVIPSNDDDGVAWDLRELTRNVAASNV